MTCGINLGILVICFLQTVQVCRSRVLQDGEGPVGASRVHGRFEGGRPQDEFRQAHVKSSSTDGRANQKLYSQHYARVASLAYPIQYSQSSQTYHKGYNKDTIYGNISPKNSFGLPSAASDSSVSKQDSSMQHNGILRPGQYVFRKPDRHSPKPSQFLSQSGSQQSTLWKPLSAAKAQLKPDLDKQAQGPNSGLNPPKEYVKETSGLSHGRKVNSASGKTPFRRIQTNPLSLKETSQLNSWQFGVQQVRKGSDYTQNAQQGSLQSGLKPGPAHMRLGPGWRFAPTRFYNVPRPFGGHPIKRLGDEEPVKQSTTTLSPRRPTTKHSAKKYTFPPRPVESYSPRPLSVHKKSKWVMIRSSQLTGAAGVLGQSSLNLQ